MDDLLPHYERELVLLRRYSREFAERYPKIAGKLQLSGDVCADPHVERLIESVALLAARVSKRLDDDYPQFTETLLEMLLPHYLRPFPSCALIQVGGAAADGKARTGVQRIARGAILNSAPVDGVQCQFTTACDVVLAPLALSAARFDALARPPAGVRLPPTAGASLGIAVSATGQAALRELALTTLRVFIDGEPSFCAALRDTLFMRTVCAHVEGADGEWKALPCVPLAPAGFDDGDALIPLSARSHPAYRVLCEYFAFPDKFNFFDIDLAAILERLPAACTGFTLHLGVAGLRPDAAAARMLASLSPANLLLACAPAVNLFRRPGVPVAVTHFSADYAVLAHAKRADAFEVYSIDSVRMVRQREQGDTLVEFRPFYSQRHGEERNGHYWVQRRDEALASVSPGHERSISLIDAAFDPMAVEARTLSIELSCTNRDLPCMLKYGQAAGDLFFASGATDEAVRLLRRPSQPSRLAAGQDIQWRLISHLTLNHHSLVQEGLDAFREMLTLYDLSQSAISQRQIGGLVGLDSERTSAWMRDARGASLVRGLEVRITLDEEAFVGSGMHLFVQVIDQFLGLYVQFNSFIELVALSQRTGEELIRCQPRNGSLNPA